MRRKSVSLDKWTTAETPSETMWEWGGFRDLIVKAIADTLALLITGDMKCVGLTQI